ncbi:MAG TPA: DUF2490 domain-containing protein [Chitinophagaceae bacterium]|nr:DUF2490 domain-containing protein [Chitinophagaceae bacterium]HAN38780.1 DUF2490 domain-containing protein [Chitinophagaceae bacterium]
MKRFVVLKLLTAVVLLAIAFTVRAQNNRISDHNKIGWMAGFVTFQVHPKWGIHSEYQFRRADYFEHWQQSLLRVGVSYQLAKDVLVRMGGAYANTYNYGEIPIQAAGKTFPELRAFQMIQLTDKKGRLDLHHRFMLEQRWVGAYSNGALTKADKTVYTNRLRYLFRMQLPLSITKATGKQWYAATFDEVLIGFGKNVNNNVFDQNRFGIIAGCKFSSTLRIEGGYFNQIAQLGRSVNSQQVFQYNQGFIVNTFINIQTY